MYGLGLGPDPTARVPWPWAAGWTTHPQRGTPGLLHYPGPKAGWAPRARCGLRPQLWVTGHPTVCPGQGDMVPLKDPACSRGLPMGCAPLIPVPIQPNHCLGDICSSIPTKGDRGPPAWPMSAARWGRAGAMAGKEQGQPEPGMRGTGRAAWGVRAGAGGLGRAGEDRGMAKGQAGWAGGTQLLVLPLACILHLPTVCSSSPPVQSGWPRCGGPSSPRSPVVGCRGRALPAGLCPHRSRALP